MFKTHLIWVHIIKKTLFVAGVPETNKERSWHTLKQLMQDITVLEIDQPGELQDFTRPLMSAGGAE